MNDHADAFIASIELRVRDILDRCTRCAKCVEVCPTAIPAGIDTSQSTAIVGEVLESFAVAAMHKAAVLVGRTRAPALGDV